jgi:hypothetical protein
MAMWARLLRGLFSIGLALTVTYSLRRNPDRQPELLFAAIALSLGPADIAFLVRRVRRTT